MSRRSQFGPDVEARRLYNAQLLRASKKYAKEQRGRSWFHLLSTVGIFASLITLTCFDALPWLVRISASILASFVLVRLFILYHDYQHGTILKGSPLAAVFMNLYGLLALNPPSAWRHSHNYHHKHNAKIFGTPLGTFPVMTVADYASASRTRRIFYRISRNPMTIASGYLTVFLGSMCVRSFIENPKGHWDAALTFLLHVALVAFLGWYNPAVLVLAILVPAILGSAVGAYLFYAQHNYPTVTLHDHADWDYVAAALESSSYLRMSKFMHWFTGNIGYHHVHHLNSRIPFYRLPEAMAGIPELQSPGTTTLSLPEIIRCFKLKLWEPQSGKLVGWNDAAALAR